MKTIDTLKTIDTMKPLSAVEADLLKRYMDSHRTDIPRESATTALRAVPVLVELKTYTPPVYSEIKIDGPTRKFSEVFFDPAPLPDFPVPDFSSVSWEPGSIVPPVDETRVLDRTSIHTLVLSLVLGLKPALVGPPGAGKSSLVEYVAAKLRWPFYRINGRRDMESETILGKPWVSGKELVWHHSEFAQAIRNGWLVLFDEPTKVPSGIAMALQRYMEHGGVLQIDDMPTTSLEEKQVKPHKWHRIVFADNVLGVGDGLDRFTSTMIQDVSFLDRRDVVIPVDYLKAEDEILLLEKHGLKFDAAHMAVSVARKIRSGFSGGELSQTCSPRNLFALCALVQVGLPLKDSMEWSIANRYPEVERETVLQIIRGVCG